MDKIIDITSAISIQGCRVASIHLDIPVLNVRTVTRNVYTDKTKALVVRGAEVVQVR